MNSKLIKDTFKMQFSVLPVCNPYGCPKGQQQGLDHQTLRDGAQGWVPSGLSCVLTQVPHWMPLTHPLQTMNKDRQKELSNRKYHQ